MNTEERLKIRRVVKSMKTAHGIVAFWLKGSPIESTLKEWLDALEDIIKEANE